MVVAIADTFSPNRAFRLLRCVDEQVFRFNFGIVQTGKVLPSCCTASTLSPQLKAHKHSQPSAFASLWRFFLFVAGDHQRVI